MYSIDHMEVYVPDRYAAAAWYGEVLGLEIVREYEAWAEDPGGPLMISGDGGRTKLALFTGEPESGAERGYHQLAFRAGGTAFTVFVERAEGLGLRDRRGHPVTHRDVKDHGKAKSFYFADPWGNRLEVTTYDVDG